MFDTIVEHYEKLRTMGGEALQNQRTSIGQFLDAPSSQVWMKQATFKLSIASLQVLRLSQRSPRRSRHDPKSVARQEKSRSA